MPKPCIRSRRRKEQRHQRFDQRGYADQFISQHSITTKLDSLGNLSYRETINSQTPGQVADALQKEFNTFDLWVMNRISKGEVLSNAFGEGAFDTKNPKPEELAVVIL